MATPVKKRLGEILIEKGLISHPQLTDALKKTNQTGGKLGASLISLGFITEDQLLEALSSSLGLPFIDIAKNVISVETQVRFPYDLVKRYRIVPVSIHGQLITIATEDPTDYRVIEELQFTTNYNIRPVLASSYQISEIIRFFEQVGYAKKPYDLGMLRKIQEKMKVLTVDMLLSELVRLDGSDLHVTVGAPPSVRLRNELQRLNLPMVDRDTVKRFVEELLTKDQLQKLEKMKDIEIPYMKDGIGRFRVVIYMQRHSLTICARNLKAEIPTLESLGLPSVIKDSVLTRQGLLLVTGPAAHGKSTTLASIINLLNENRALNIITLEDPIEYLHKHKKCNINQREIGEDTASFVKGLKHVFRQNPDVIMIGELRDPESIHIAMKAAATGHLVLATMHTQDTASAIDTILNYFSGNEQNVIRQQLADSLICVISQRLVPRKSGEGRCLAYELMLNSSRIAALIREGKPHQIKVQTAAVRGDMETLEYSLANMVKRGIISAEDATHYALNKKSLEDILAQKRPEGTA